MKICEGCIKQDTCKFREEVEMQEKFDAVVTHTLREPLEVSVTCRYKQNGYNIPYVTVPNIGTDDSKYKPDYWTTTDAPHHIATYPRPYDTTTATKAWDESHVTYTS